MKKIILFGLIGLIVVSGCTQQPPAGWAEDQESLIVADPTEFALNIFDVEQGHTIISPNFGNLTQRDDSLLSLVIAYWPIDQKDVTKPLGEEYALTQNVKIAFDEDLNQAIARLGGPSESEEESSRVIEENFVVDAFKISKEGTGEYWKSFDLEFRVKNVLVNISLRTQTLADDIAIEKLKRYAKIVYDKITKATLAKPLPSGETESVFGTCEKDNTCKEELFCNKSQFCSPTMNGVFCSDEGDEKCYKQCTTDQDCQDLCNGKIDCTKYLTKCLGTINLWSGDTVWPNPICVIFKKTS